MEVRFAIEYAWDLPPDIPEFTIPPATPARSDSPHWSFSELMRTEVVIGPREVPLGNASYRLLVFLATLNYPCGPISGFLYRMWAASVAKEDLSGWLCTAFRTTEAAMEAGFEEFWRKGTVSLKGR
jgi:hypothetical protein